MYLSKNGKGGVAMCFPTVFYSFWPSQFSKSQPVNLNMPHPLCSFSSCCLDECSSTGKFPFINSINILISPLFRCDPFRITQQLRSPEGLIPSQVIFQLFTSQYPFFLMISHKILSINSGITQGAHCSNNFQMISSVKMSQEFLP